MPTSRHIQNKVSPNSHLRVLKLVWTGTVTTCQWSQCAMGNTSGKPHPRPRNKKYLQFLGAERPSSPGKPYLAGELEATPDVLTIRWDPPVKNGGTPITGYLVEHRRTGSPHWVRATPLMVHVPELTLSGLEPGWRYQFRIFAENLAGLSEPSELSEPLTVTLQRNAITAPKFTQELHDTIALENEKVEFVVHFIGQPAPKLCWFKDGFEIFSSRRTRILTEHDRSILTIHQSAICDEGEIKCAATNKAGHVSTKARLTLEAPPSIRLPRQYEDGLLFEIGELIRLKVSVAGLPPPLIFWTHNGDSLNDNERYEIENDDKTSTLRISEAHRNDRGEYRIKAVNKLGSDIASFLVTVTDKPSPPGKAKVIMTLGRSVTLNWNTPEDDGGCKIGSYIVEYYRLGWNVWLKAATSRQLTTILGDLIEGSEYKFRVKAESPFGVSEPSEESELIFIPDPKRGILEPVGGRSRSQPRDNTDPNAPVAAKRKKPRSRSSPRGGDGEEESPQRPERSKIKSPPKTPEKLSPKLERKEIASSINKAIFDRAIGREINYGSPEIKIKKTDVPVPKEIAEVKPTPQRPNQSLQDSIKNTIQVIDKQKQKSPSPIKARSPSPVKSKPPFPNGKQEVPKFLKEASPNKRDRLKSPVFSRDNSEDMRGSSEFMMVLYPGENTTDTSEFDYGMDNVPPPLSLSAPELGAEPPPFETLRLSASSTELLHERAMLRFYQEALAEEEAIQRKLDRADDDRRHSLIPKIQINNKEEQFIVGLERKHSLRKRAGGSVPQQVLLAQKRHSLRGSSEFSDLFDTKLPKLPLTADEKRELMQTRQRSHSEEVEEEEFERVRQRMAEKQAKGKPKKNIDILDEDVWEPEEHYSFSEDESSGDERFRAVEKVKTVQAEEEDMTYHPRVMIPTENKSKYEEPFEILTKPAKLPDANFIPKPILKKKENEEIPTPIKSAEEVESRLFQEYSQRPLPPQPATKRGSLPEAPVSQTEDRSTSAVASVSGITAAGIVMPQPFLQQREADEARIVIDHYADIVKSATIRRQSQPENNPIREALRQAAKLQAALHQCDDKEEEEEKPKPANGSKAFASRFKELERKLETTASAMPPRSATPIFKQSRIENTNADLFEKRPPIKNGNVPAISVVPATPVTPSVPVEPVRGREEGRYGTSKRSSSRSKPRKSSPSPAPVPSRSESTTKKKQRSRSNSTSKPPSRSSSKQRPLPKSPSPPPPPSLLRRPRMCEIMTQTSNTIDPYAKSTQTTPYDEILKEEARATVRTTVDYITDLAMFAVACWLYIFDNELFALPVLLVACYRQLKDEMKNWVPNWVRRRWNKKKKE